MDDFSCKHSEYACEKCKKSALEWHAPECKCGTCHANRLDRVVGPAASEPRDQG